MNLLNKKIFDFSGTAMGLNLSDSSIRIVQFERRGRKERILGYGSAPIYTGSIYDGVIVKMDQVVSSIRNALSKPSLKGIKSNKVICSVPETKAFLRIISIPMMNEKEVHEAIKWEIEANIPLSLDQVYYDWQILSENISHEKSKMDVLVVAVARKVVDQFIEALELAGLEVVGLEIESLAQARCLLSENKPNVSALVIDFDERRTGFFVANKGVPCFTSSAQISGQSINNSISKAMGVSLEEAENIKINYGIGSDFNNTDIFDCVRPVLENLVSDIEKSMEFFLSELGYSDRIDEIIISGKEANIKGICPFLSKRIGKKVILGNPWENISVARDLPEIDRYKSLEYCTAIGLALKGLDYEDMH